MNDDYLGYNIADITYSLTKYIATYAFKRTIPSNSKLPYEIDIYKTISFLIGLKQAIRLFLDKLERVDIKCYDLLCFTYIGNLLAQAIMLESSQLGRKHHCICSLQPFDHPIPSSKKIEGIIDKDTNLVVITEESGNNSSLVNHITHLMKEDYKIKGIVSLIDWEYIPVGEILKSYGLFYYSCITLPEIIEQYNNLVFQKE